MTSDANVTALFMAAAFALGFLMVVFGGLGFMKRSLVLIETRSKIAQAVVFAAAGLMFVAGIGVHFTGSSNTAFLKGQLASASRCELQSEAEHPEARGGASGVIGHTIVGCMTAAGFDWSLDNALCREAPVATNAYCYAPREWFARTVTVAQLAFD